MKAWYSIFANSQNQLSFLLSSRYGDLSAILLKKGSLRVFDQTSWNKMDERFLTDHRRSEDKRQNDIFGTNTLSCLYKKEMLHAVILY